MAHKDDAAARVHLSTEIPDLEAILQLYDSVGWTAYTRDPERLQRAIAASTWTVSAWDEGLVGFARVLSDDEHIAWLQDILVAPTHHRQGIGRKLMTAARERFAHVRSMALMTDDRPEQHAFYASLGFADTQLLKRTSLHTFVRMVGVELE